MPAKKRTAARFTTLLVESASPAFPTLPLAGVLAAWKNLWASSVTELHQLLWVHFPFGFAAWNFRFVATSEKGAMSSVSFTKSKKIIRIFLSSILTGIEYDHNMWREPGNLCYKRLHICFYKNDHKEVSFCMLLCRHPYSEVKSIPHRFCGHIRG